MQVLQKIKELRKKKGFSQKYMAEKLNISVSGYGKIELGENVLSIDRFFEICKILGIESYNQVLPAINVEIADKIEKTLVIGGASFENIRSNSLYAIRIIDDLIEAVKNGSKQNEDLINELNLILKFLDLIRAESFKHGLNFQSMLTLIESLD